MKSQSNDIQDITRNELNALIECMGIKANFLAKLIGLDPSVLCRFRQNKKDLYPETLAKLQEVLAKYKAILQINKGECFK